MLETLQIAANLCGWGHWTRILALAIHLPQVHFRVYHTLHPLPLPNWIHNVEKVDHLQTGSPLICDRDWCSALPYQPSDFSHSLCIHRCISLQPFDPADYNQVIYVGDVDAEGDVPPIVLETPIVDKPFASHVIASSEQHNCAFLQDKYPNYVHRVIYPITSMRQQIEHLVGTAGYNLFWECVYYQIPCTLYGSVYESDSVLRMEKLGSRPMPDPFPNGAPAVAQAIQQWWLSVI